MGIQWVDSFVNLLAGMGVPGRDKFASQAYTFVPMTQFDLEAAYRGDWIARKVVDIPASDMTREWREWQADEAQVELLEELEKNLFVQQKLQQALIKSRLYGGAIMIMGVDNGAPEEELDPESVGKDSLKFLHVVSMINVAVGPLETDVTSPYYGLPTWYEVRSGPQGSLTQQVQLHPSRVVRFIGSALPDPTMSGQQWGDSVLQSVNDAVKMCGLVSGSLATLISELKIDIIKIPDMTEIVSTAEGTSKLQTRFATANAMKSVINTVILDSTEEWQRVQANLAGVPEVISTYLQIASGAADIPAGRFLGLPHRGLNVTGEADFRNYYDKLAGEQTTVLTPAMSILDEVIIRSALGSRPPEIYYEWKSLWQLSDGDKADIALKKAQAYQIDVNAAQIPPVALANGRVNQLIEDGTYPGLQNALEDAAAEGDTIEEQNAPQPMLMPGVDPVTGQPLDPNAPPPKGGNGGTPPPNGGQTGQLPPNARKSTLPGGRGAGDSAVLPFVEDENECHNPSGAAGGQFCSEPGAGGGVASEGKGKGGKGKVEVDSVSKFRADKVGVSPGNDKELLAVWNKTIGMEPGEFKKSFLGGADGEMTVRAKGYGYGEDREVYIEITGKLKDADGKTIGSYTREIDTSKNTAESSLLEVDKAAQSHGIAKTLLAGNIATYRQIGLKHVNVHANIDVGGYAWAKYGYVPNQSSWNKLRDQIIHRIGLSPPEVQAAAKAELGAALKSKDPKAVWVIADSPRFGKQILLGSDWHGKLNFKDKESMKRFDSYVGRKKKAHDSKHSDADVARMNPARTPKSPPPASKEFYYVDDAGVAQDASLHDEILDGGDDAEAKKVSDAVKARILKE